MVFVLDEGSVFDAPLDAVWSFVGSGDEHSRAHRHRAWQRELGEGNSGTYSWEQEFGGSTARFTMHWVSYHPLGVAYDVREGPFAGSRFFLYYIPRGPKTAVTVAGTFTSESIPEERLEEEVRRFFSVEFDQDHAAIRARAGRP